MTRISVKIFAEISNSTSFWLRKSHEVIHNSQIGIRHKLHVLRTVLLDETMKSVVIIIDL